VGRIVSEKQRFYFSPDLRTGTVLPNVVGFNNLNKTCTEQPMRILISGCRADNRSALELFLQKKPDLDVVASVGDFQSLLTQANTSHPDIILLDWDLCDRPLEELISALHLFESQPGVILISVTRESGQAGLTAGADAFVVKGDPPKSLMIAIETIRLKREADRLYEK
jgi:DNA-binding NarL/FixJ family response regulator